MSQVSWRAEEWLVERVKLAARKSGRSMNEYLTVVLDAATDPTHAGTDAQQVRERLRLAGLLDDGTGGTTERPSADAVRAAGKRAARGTALSDLVTDAR